ncbi:MAG: sigma-54 dependent transcriptional regulator [Candidatus Cloacimonetes bacterium]|nr:sigma-54 dependent transcriptional regulator [Candidatus Cloacimonadota bacterium]
MRILIIDDEVNICISLKNILEDEGYHCIYALNEKDALKKIEQFIPDVILLDVKLGRSDGLETLQKVLVLNPTIIVIMISGHSGIKEAVTAIKLGAYDFLEKPLSLSKIKVTVKNAIKLKQVSTDYDRLKNTIREKYKIVGESKKINDLKNLITKVAKTTSKVLIRGESGTGKELIAFAIHDQSLRTDKSFIKFNSAAIPKELVESELFGYEKGAFTGAIKTKKGKIELADNGTLFLDEIGDMDFSAQAKILRVIQEGEFERVGSNEVQKINTRVIAATNQNLEEMVNTGKFREDLFYRLNVIPIKSPALNEHAEDIPLLVEHFSNYFSKELNIPLKIFHTFTLKKLQEWQFKGNVRELSNFIERIYILVDKTEILPEDINIFNKQESKTDFWNQTCNFKEKRHEFEKKYLTVQLRLNNSNLTKTADVLGLQVSNLSRKIKELNIKDEN